MAITRKGTALEPKIELNSFGDDFLQNLMDGIGFDDPEQVTAMDVMTYPRDPVDWIQTHFFIPELMGPLKLFPYHQAVLREAYRTDEDGNYVYDTILWSDIKKSLKSVIAASVVAERARRLPWGQIRLIGNSKDQAASRSFFYLQRAIQLNPAMRDTVVSRQYTVVFPNRATVQAIPMNPNSQAGGNDSMVVWTELWGADPRTSEQMFIELTIPPNLHGKAQRWIETYAGYTGVSILLERLYNAGVKDGHIIDLGIPGLEVYANPEIRMLALWNTVPRLPFQTDSYYASEAAVLSPSEYMRVHRNQWVSPTTEFVPAAWWDACKRELPPMDKYRQVAIGVDAAVTSDSFGIVAVSREDDNVIVREVREWIPPKNGKIEFTNHENNDDPDYPEGFIRMLVEKYNVVVVAYDPYQLALFASKIEAENLAWMKEFPQGPKRAQSDKMLYDMIRDRRLMHDGNETLTRHIQNADSTADGETRLRLVKKNQALKIDLAVALSMATSSALEFLAP